MIRISKNFLFNPAQIWISGIKCNTGNIAKISNTLDFKWIVITMDSLKKDSSLLTLVMERGLKYFIKKHFANYMEVSVLLPYSLFEEFLKKAIAEDPENIFVYNVLDHTNWYIQSQCSFKELVVTGITNVFVSISLDENALLISVNKSLSTPQEIYRRIKELRFD